MNDVNEEIAVLRVHSLFFTKREGLIRMTYTSILFLCTSLVRNLVYLIFNIAVRVNDP